MKVGIRVRVERRRDLTMIEIGLIGKAGGLWAIIVSIIGVQSTILVSVSRVQSFLRHWHCLKHKAQK